MVNGEWRMASSLARDKRYEAFVSLSLWLIVHELDERWEMKWDEVQRVSGGSKSEEENGWRRRYKKCVDSLYREREREREIKLLAGDWWFRSLSRCALWVFHTILYVHYSWCALLYECLKQTVSWSHWLMVDIDLDDSSSFFFSC